MRPPVTRLLRPVNTRPWSYPSCPFAHLPLAPHRHHFSARQTIRAWCKIPYYSRPLYELRGRSQASLRRHFRQPAVIGLACCTKVLGHFLGARLGFWLQCVWVAKLWSVSAHAGTCVLVRQIVVFDQRRWVPLRASQIASACVDSMYRRAPVSYSPCGRVVGLHSSYQHRRVQLLYQ